MKKQLFDGLEDRKGKKIIWFMVGFSLGIFATLITLCKALNW